MAGKIQGTVVDVSEQGDLITDIHEDRWRSVARTSETKILVDEEHETFGLFESNHNQPSMTLIAIVESDKPLRLHLVSDSAAMMLGVRRGASVQVLW